MFAAFKKQEHAILWRQIQAISFDKKKAFTKNPEKRKNPEKANK